MVTLLDLSHSLVPPFARNILVALCGISSHMEINSSVLAGMEIAGKKQKLVVQVEAPSSGGLHENMYSKSFILFNA